MLEFDLSNQDKYEIDLLKRINALIIHLQEIYDVKLKFDIAYNATRIVEQNIVDEKKREKLYKKRKQEYKDQKERVRVAEDKEKRRERQPVLEPGSLCSKKCRKHLRQRISILTAQVNVLRENGPSIVTETSCSLQKTKKECIQDFACGWCISNISSGNGNCSEGTARGPIYEKCQHNNTNWIHMDKLGVAKSNPAESWDRDVELAKKIKKFKINNQQADIKWPKLGTANSIWKRVGFLNDTNDLPTEAERREGAEVPNKDIPTKNTPSIDKYDSNIPRYIGADDIQARHHWGNLSTFVYRRYNSISDPCSGFEGTPAECAEAIKIEQSRGITYKVMDPGNNSHVGGNNWDPTVRGKNGFNVLDNSHKNANEFSSGVPLMNTHKFPNEDEDARGVVNLNTDEEIMLPSNRKGSGSVSAEDIVLNVGSKIDARWLGGCFYEPATISALNPDGSFDIRYVNGKMEQRVTRFHIKIRDLVYGDMCKAQGCPYVTGGKCPYKAEFSKPKTKTPGYDCVGNGDVCESQRFCCGELICSLGKDERKRCIDASDEINKYGLGGLVTTSSIDKDGDISYLKSSSSPVPGPMEILAKERAKLKISGGAAEKMAEAEKRQKKGAALKADKFGAAALDKTYFDSATGGKAIDKGNQPTYMHPNFGPMPDKHPFLETMGKLDPDPNPTNPKNFPLLDEGGGFFFKRTNVNFKKSIPHHIGEYHVDVDTDYKYTDSHSVIKSQKHNDQLSVESPEVIKKSNSDFHCNPRGGTCRNHDDCCLNLACDPKNMLCTVVEFRDEEEDQEKDPKKAVKSTTSSQISSKTRNQRIVKSANIVQRVNDFNRKKGGKGISRIVYPNVNKNYNKPRPNNNKHGGGGGGGGGAPGMNAPSNDKSKKYNGQPILPSLPKSKPKTKCKGLTRFFCNRVNHCCWEFPPTLPHREINPGECKFTSDGNCDFWDKSKPYTNKKPYSGGGTKDGSVFDNISSVPTSIPGYGSAEKLADKIQSVRAKIGANALKAINSGNKPGDINTYENEFADVEGGGPEIIHRVHFDFGNHSSEKKSVVVPKPVLSLEECQPYSIPKLCHLDRECEHGTRCLEHHDPRDYKDMARTGKIGKDGFFSNDYIKRSNPFIPLMSCECGEPSGGNCYKNEDCREGLRCIVQYNMCIVPRKVGENCNTNYECEDGLSCAPSGECIDEGGIGSSCTKQYEREDCAYGLLCIKGECKGDTGAPCETTVACAPDMVCSNGIEKPDAILQAQEAMQKRLKPNKTIEDRGILRAIDPLQGTFYHDPRNTKESKVTSKLLGSTVKERKVRLDTEDEEPTSLLETRVRYVSYVDIMYQWAFKPTNKLAECIRNPAMAIKTWKIPKEIVAMFRFYTNAQIPILVKMNGDGILDPRQSFNSIQGSCTLILRRLGGNVSNLDAGMPLKDKWVPRTQPRRERETRMQMMRDIIREKTPWTRDKGLEVNGNKPIKQNEEVELYYRRNQKPDLIAYPICVLDKWLHEKPRKRECCPCNMTETLTLTENRMITGKKIHPPLNVFNDDASLTKANTRTSFLDITQQKWPIRHSFVQRRPVQRHQIRHLRPDVKAAMRSKLSQPSLSKNPIKVDSIPEQEEEETTHILKQFGDTYPQKLTPMREEAVDRMKVNRETKEILQRQMKHNKGETILLELPDFPKYPDLADNKTIAQNAPNLPDDHPYLGYGIDSRPQCCECKFVDGNTKAEVGAEEDREDTQMGDIRKWADAYDRDTFLLPKKQKDAGGLENPCKDQLSLACLRHNEQIKTAKIDDLERWGEFGGKQVWRAPIINVSSLGNKTAVNLTAGISLGDPGENAGPKGDHFLKSSNATEELKEVRKKIANINAPSVNPPEYDNKE